MCAHTALFTTAVSSLASAAGCSLPTPDVICSLLRPHPLSSNACCDRLLFVIDMLCRLYSAASSCCAPLGFFRQFFKCSWFRVRKTRESGGAQFPLVEVPQEAMT